MITIFVVSTASAVVTDNEISERYLVPKSLSWAVVKGTKTTSSALPNPWVHFAFITPITVRILFPIRISFPIGFTSPNNTVAVSDQITATLSTLSTFLCVMKDQYSTVELRT